MEGSRFAPLDDSSVVVVVFIPASSNGRFLVAFVFAGGVSGNDSKLEGPELNSDKIGSSSAGSAHGAAER